MIKFFLVLLTSLQSAFALEAVITVLETPMLKSKSADAPVVQYLRKGDVIKVHPSLANDQSIEVHSPTPAKLAAIRKKLQESTEWNTDPLFKDARPETAYLEDEFIPTLDRQGNTVYVLSSHLYIYFENSRESLQVVTKDDPTDYRLEEPLSKKYPFYHETGYRGQVTLGITQPNFESYPYQDSVLAKSYTSPLDLNISLYRQPKGRSDDRYYLGGTFNFKHFINAYTLANSRKATETGIKFGAGPSLSFDAFKGSKDRINLSGHLLVNFLNQLQVKQKDLSGSDSRTYRSYSLVPKISVQYHRKQVLEDIDFVIGTSIELETVSVYTATEAAQRPEWWQAGGDDEFTARTSFALSGFLGFQSAY
ncbi:MAG TPA: hypothetical protein VNJ01_01640 [Bacteriovoracaceae bacterium]|nr:hypothetical protein [Bacteriovoracaceae bacterium]